MTQNYCLFRILIVRLIVRLNHGTHGSTFNILTSKVEFAASCLLQLLHNFHQILRHEVWTSHSIILLAIFTEANENGVDGHFINGHEAVDDEEPENGAKDDRYSYKVDAFLSLKIVQRMLS